MKGLDIPAINTEQMVEVDRLMMEVYGIDLVRMMENAGRNLAHLSRRLLGGTALNKQVAVAAGKGNNGGGGLVAARHLSNWSAQVTVVLTGPKEEHKPVPREQLDTLEHLPVAVVETWDEEDSVFEDADLAIDAVIGYGLTGSPRGAAARLIELINTCKGTILSLDAPSGLDTSSGEMFSPGVRVMATMTLALPKTGLLTGKAKESVGELYLADISVPPSLYRHLGLEVAHIFAEDTIVSVG